MWSKAKNGLVQPSKVGKNKPVFLLRKREISRNFAIENPTKVVGEIIVSKLFYKIFEKGK